MLFLLGSFRVNVHRGFNVGVTHNFLDTSYMERAETMFEKGADRKEWVMAMVKASADTVKYDLDMDKISDLIDSLCDMSKIVNGTSNTAR